MDGKTSILLNLRFKKLMILLIQPIITQFDSTKMDHY